MKICIMGAGGLGGFFGGWLAAAGADVTFIARGGHLTAMRESGLEIRSPLGDRLVRPVCAAGDPAEAGPADIVLFCVKTYDLETAAESCRPLLHADTAVISLLNGVEAPDRLAAILGETHAVPGLTYIPSNIAAPGVIEHKGESTALLFGERDGRASPRLEAFRALCRTAGIDAEIDADIMTALWRKFILWCGTSATTSLSRSPFGVVQKSPELRRMYEAVVREARAVAAAQGVVLPENLVDDLVGRLDAMPPAATSSTQRDLANGRPLELEAGLGALVRLGRASALATPVSDTAYAALLPHADGAPAG